MSASNTSQKPRILFVEDHADTLYATSALLVRNGYKVFTAMDVKTALVVGEANPFDLLIADINLPDGMGWEILEKLRQTRSFPSIALTALCSPEDLKNHLAKGFDVCVAKPYQVKDLEENIGLLLKMQ